mgnify:CR=1 FL=1
MNQKTYEQDMVDKLVSNYTSINFVYQNVMANPDVGFSGLINGNNYFFIFGEKLISPIFSSFIES